MEREATSEVGELFAENQSPAMQTRLEGLVLDLQDGARLLGRHALNIAKHDRRPIDRRQGEDRAKHTTAELRPKHLLVGHVAPVGHLHLRYLNPLPSNLGDIFKRYKKILVPELNMGQLLWVLRAKYLVDAVGLNKIQGRPFKQAELEQKIEEMLGL